MEPRHSIHHLRADSLSGRSIFEGEQEEDAGGSPAVILMEHDAPESPIHPALEYEIVPTSQSNEEECPQRRSRSNEKSDFKLYLSFLALIITGSANVVTSKLQAIPM